MLIRPASPTSRAIRPASIAYTSMCLARICSWTGRGSASQTSSGGCRQLSSSVAPGAARPSTSTCSSSPNWWQPTKLALLHEVGRPDRLRPEAQVRHGLRAGLLRVVDEVALGVQVLLGPEDLDRVLVRADRPVRAEPEEDRADRVGRLDVQRRVVGQARAGDVVVDADREPAPRPLARELVEHAGDHARGELLRRQAVAAADHPRHDLALAVRVRLGQRGDHVEEQRLARSSRAPWCGPAPRPGARSRAAPRPAPGPGTAGTAAPAPRRPAHPAR